MGMRAFGWRLFWGVVFGGPGGAAYGALSASATISTGQTSAPFDYTITLTNNGTTSIGTFWFAWTSVPINYDFLPTSPSSVTAPAGWTTLITHSGFPGDGYGLEMYNLSGSAIGAGQTGLFHFTTNDTPAQIGGNAFIAPNKVGTSFVYIGLPQTDPGFKFNALVVPEPSCALVMGVGLLVWGWGRSRTRGMRGKILRSTSG
jgi:hypothetical protein